MTELQGRRRATLALASAFGVGALAGAGGSWWAAFLRIRGRRLAPGEYKQWLLNELDERLDLDDVQREQVESILDETSQRFAAVREAMEPEFDAINSDREDQVMAVLRPEQQQAYEQLLAARNRRGWQGRGRIPPRGR